METGSEFCPHFITVSNDPAFVSLVREYSTRICAPLDEYEHRPSHGSLADDTANIVLVDLDTAAGEDLEIPAFIDGIRPVDVVIAVLSQPEPARALRLLDAGAFDVITKPIAGSLLNHCLRRAVEYVRLAFLERHHRKIVDREVEEKTLEIVRAKEFLKGILDSSTLVSVVLTDLDQNILFWNTGAENIFGYPAEEVLNRKITILYPEDHPARTLVEEMRSTALGKQITTTGKMVQTAKDGRHITVHLAISPMIDSTGETQGILGMGLDVTEESRQQEEILRLLGRVEQTQDTAIFSLARIAESRDEETGLHLKRIQGYCRALCTGMSRRERFAAIITEEFVEDLVRTSILHDIGKVSIPDSILLSPDKFTPEQHDIMKRHTTAGGGLLLEAVEKLGESSLFSMGMQIARHHHEKWDGGGYPDGLAGEDIPLPARIVAIADVYDALTTKRRYKRAFSHEEAAGIILDGRGTHFDPELADVFDEVRGEFEAIRAALSPESLH